MAVIIGRMAAQSLYGFQWGQISDDLDDLAFLNFTAFDASPVNLSSALTSNLPVSQVSNAKSGKVLNNYFDDFYNRFHISQSIIDVGNLIAPKNEVIEIWNAYIVQQTLNDVTGVNADGINIVEPAGNSAPTVYNPLESMVYTLNITTIGPPTINASIQFNFVSGSLSIAVVGMRVVVWPYKPNYPIKESLEWKTDVIAAFSSEQRIALRDAARLSLQYEAVISPVDLAKAKAIAFQWVHRVFGAPMWLDIRYVGAIDAGATYIDVDTTKADFRSDDLILIWVSNDSYEVVDTTTVTTTRINLKEAISSQKTKAYVVPVRFAYALSGLKFSRDSDAVIKAHCDFDVRNNKNVGASIGLPTFKSLPVFTDDVMTDDAVADKYVRTIDIFDNGSGIIEVDNQTNYLNTTTNVSIRAFTRAEAWRYKQFFSSLRGKQKSFFIPSKHDDFIVVENIPATNALIKIQSIGFTLYYRDQYLMLKTKAGVLHYAKVLSSIDLGGGIEQLNLETAFGVDISYTNIAQACLLKHVRLDSDKIDFTHDVADHMRCSFTVREVPYGL